MSDWEFNEAMSNHRAHTNDPHPEHGANPALDPYAQGIPEVGHSPASVPAVREEAPQQVEPEKLSEPTPARQEAPVGATKTIAGGTWVALIVGALLLIALLVFILQNQASVELNIITWTFEIPAGIAYLLCAIAGALIMAMVGGVRMFEYRRKIKKMKKALS